MKGFNAFLSSADSLFAGVCIIAGTAMIVASKQSTPMINNLGKLLATAVGILTSPNTGAAK